MGRCWDLEWFLCTATVSKEMVGKDERLCACVMRYPSCVPVYG